jgi:hypothetical protein
MFMGLNTAEQFLVILLSSALAVFLIIGIIVLVRMLTLLKTLQFIADKAEHVVESAEAAADVIKNASGPFGVFALLRGLVDMAMQHKHSKDDNDKDKE